MSSQTKSFDTVWEDLYGNGLQIRCPYDFVASFIYRNAPKNAQRQDVKILEVGSGTGNNLWFLAGEGFDVYGIDGSEAAVASAQKRFADSKLNGNLKVGDFTKLEFADNMFDCVIDRGALTCCGTTSMKNAIAEIHRVTKKGGFFLYNPIADSDSSYRASEVDSEGLSTSIKGGDFAGVGQIRFVSRREVDEFLPKEKWDIQRLERVEIQDMLNATGKTVASWRVESKKI